MSAREDSPLLSSDVDEKATSNEFPAPTNFLPPNHYRYGSMDNQRQSRMGSNNSAGQVKNVVFLT